MYQYAKKSMQVNKLIIKISKWIIDDNIAETFDIYTHEEWVLLGENYHQDSAAVINIGIANLRLLLDNHTKFIIFDDLTRSLGFYFQFGKPGHIGFNPIFNFDHKDSSLPNNLLYMHRKWLSKKRLILTNARFRCQYCNSFQELDIYNRNFQDDNAPWEYPLNNYKVLCAGCLNLHTRLETIFRTFIPNITHQDLDNILDRIHPDFDWYHPNNIEDYVSTIWPLIPSSVK